MRINRVKLEKLTTSLAVTLLTLMVIVLTLAAANTIFRWDLFSAEVEKIGWLLVTTSFLIIFSSVIINIMINIGRIADRFDSRNRSDE